MLPANEAYLLLFQDSLLAAIIISFDSELVFDVMRSFGGYNTQIILVTSFLASILGHMINFFAGKIIFDYRNFFKLSTSTEKNILKASALSNKYGFVFLLFIGSNFFGPIISFTAGLFSVRLRTFILTAITGKTLYYLEIFYEVL